MSLRQDIQDDLKICLKEKKEERLSALRLLWDVITKKEKQKIVDLQDVAEDKKEQESQLEDKEIQELVASSVKKNKEAIIQFKQGGRNDLAEKNEREIEVLMKYLPEQMGEQEITALIEKAIEETQAKGLADFGKVMGKVMLQAKGKTDGEIVGKIVKEKLSQEK
ncbi:GatB/YqeY domain-containing protein [Patescibacteria group bacterium]|nr:GatB/YqeY domain-containing protein [Patescibacteria group bacterium]MBU4022925.1 GatB/YqeY domain-containing protein [Patescibacteria group bacterium]MBU4078301.1 GatB/YqeY domain-containing protein [Patescibacteria group bacterium]